MEVRHINIRVSCFHPSSQLGHKLSSSQREKLNEVPIQTAMNTDLVPLSGIP